MPLFYCVQKTNPIGLIWFLPLSLPFPFPLPGAVYWLAATDIPFPQTAFFSPLGASPKKYFFLSFSTFFDRLA